MFVIFFCIVDIEVFVKQILYFVDKGDIEVYWVLIYIYCIYLSNSVCNMIGIDNLIEYVEI